MPTENLNKTQARFYEGCLLLRDGAVTQSESRLGEAIDLLDESMDNADRIVLKTLNISFDGVQADTVSMTNHVYFTSDYAQYLYDKIDTPYIEKASVLRDIQKSDCAIHQLAVKAHGTVECRASMNDTCQVFVMAEPGGTLKLTVKDDGNGEIYEGTPYEEGAVSYVEWIQSPNPDTSKKGGSQKRTLLRIENTSSNDISFIIASN
ncbi:MAG: hypothetical protein LUC23_03970 [Prevotellaceae bacterium]|nr:hypothetical protein [Prevotellaceae bacterium]